MNDDLRLVPLLVVRAADAAIDFYCRAFGATCEVRFDNKVNDTVSHADLAIGEARVSITEEARAWNADAPPSLGGSPVVLQLRVADAAAALARAEAAGAEVVFPLQDFCGDRMARVRDPFGHLWILRERVERLSPEEGQRRRDALFASLAGTLRTTSTSRTAPSLSTPSSPAFASAVELARRIRAGEHTSRELTAYFIERIERLDGAVNAVVVRDFDRALAAAERADQARERGEPLGPLHGVPLTVKEAFDVAGLPTTWGLASFADNIATADADVVARLRAAGAIIVGKTNVPTRLGDFQTSNERFGTTRNPWDLARGPGGSSGGAAAALAASFTALECGSDIGGSIRNPAHYCGVHAHKPTFGIISPRGHALPSIPSGHDMAVVGPLARSAADLRGALEVLVGPGAHDAAGWRIELPPPRRSSPRGLRVAVWRDDAIAPVDDAIARAVERVADQLARRGAIVSDRARPPFDVEAYRRTYVGLVSSVMGATTSDDEYEVLHRQAAAIDPGDTSKLAAAARGMVLGHRAWRQLDAVRGGFRDAWRTFFTSWDVLICPIMASPAFVHDTRPPLTRTVTVNGTEQPYFDQVFWACLATLAYLPATVFPAGRSSAGLPIGVQAIGAAHDDLTTIELARWLEEDGFAFVPPPDFDTP